MADKKKLTHEEKIKKGKEIHKQFVDYQLRDEELKDIAAGRLDKLQGGRVENWSYECSGSWVCTKTQSS